MTATYESLEYSFYNGGSLVTSASQVVGYNVSSVNGNTNRVIRYKFTAPAEGANTLSFTKKNVSVYNDSISPSTENLRFYITDSESSHINAGEGSVYHGTVTVADGTVTGYIEDLILLPGKTYYLYIFPGFSSHGLYAFNYPNEITLTLGGASGLAWIYIAESFVVILLFIYIQGEWKLAIPYVHDGQMWKLCS